MSDERWLISSVCPVGSLLEHDVLKPGSGAVWGSAGSERVTNSAPGNGVTAESFDYEVRVYSDQSTPPVGVHTDVVVVDVSF